MKPMDLLKKKSLRGTDGIKCLWEALPDVPFFEVPFPVEREAGSRLPLLTEASDPKFLHPYLKIYQTLSSTGEVKAGKKLLLLDLSESGERARRVAINLSLVFAFEKLKVNLIDLDFKAPALHRLLGMRNLDGLTDHLLLGTPVSDIIRETNIPGLSLITTGRQLEFKREYLKEIAWESVVKELTPAEGIAFCVLRKEAGSEEEEMLPCFDGIFLFFSERYSISSDIRKWLRDLRKESHICGILWSQDILIDSHGHSWPGGGPEKETLLAARSTAEGGTMTGGEKDIIESDSPPQVHQEEPELGPELWKKVKLSRQRERRGFELLGPVLLIFGLFVIILGGLLWWSGYFEGKRDTIVLEKKSTDYLAEGAAGTAAETQVPPADLPGTESAPPVSEVVPESPPAAPVAAEPARVALTEADCFYTINIASYTDDKWAKSGLEKLAAAGIGTYLVPVDIPGKGTWIRLMMGSFGNKEEAQEEMQRLMGEGVLKEGWVMQTPYAFLVGEWSNKEEAVSAMTSLIAQGLFPYIVSREEGGIARHRVFLGAYQGKDQASSLEKILRDRGRQFTLVERRG
jgi:cell division septation protein DedD